MEAVPRKRVRTRAAMVRDGNAGLVAWTVLMVCGGVIAEGLRALVG